MKCIDDVTLIYAHEYMYIDTDDPLLYLIDYNMYKTNSKIKIKKRWRNCNFCTH